MPVAEQVLEQSFLEEIFPAERTDAFFDAIFGGVEEGAYDIALVCRSLSPSKTELAFELRQRPGKCLACNLTYGLPQVFQRHPVINVPGIAKTVAEHLGWETEGLRWRLGATEETSRELHAIPLILERSRTE
ncbi:MAG: hypothetical protein LBR31_00300 [Desulfovibrio sp.]|jgi:hypothetical protein|nr:hypothetical protein [Desulfovibrio sp.]